MAIFEIVEGAPGQGKSLYTARLTFRLLQRNKNGLNKLVLSVKYIQI